MPAELIENIFFYITDDCNLRCKHCWVNAGIKKNNNQCEITLEQIKDVIDQSLPLGLKSIKLSGGEPLLRSDVEELIDYASSKGLKTTIETNAVLVNSKLAISLKKANTCVSVSLDSHEPGEHDSFRGVKGSFVQTIDGIKCLVRHGINVHLITCIYRGNYRTVEEIVKLGLNMGVTVFKLNQINLDGRAKTHLIESDLLTYAEYIKLNRYIEDELSSKYKTACITLDIPLAFKSLKAIRDGRYFSCSPKRLLAILANGDISLCGIGNTVKELIFGNIRNLRIKDVWTTNNCIQEIRKVVPHKLEGVCTICMMRNFCQGRCRADAYSHFSSLAAPMPICHYAYESGIFPQDRLIDQLKPGCRSLIG